MEEKFHGTKELSMRTNTELKEVESHEEKPEDFEESDVLLLVDYCQGVQNLSCH
jgi:hypothetical protein